MTVLVGRDDLSFAEVVAVAREGERAALAPGASRRMASSRALLEAAADRSCPVYGITTGFGALADTPIPPDARAELQHALLRSHAAGMGPPAPREVVRAMLLLRANTLAKGYSGVRPALARGLLALLNAGITPFVPVHGSLGASGDLAPLAHAALCLVGEGWVLGDDGGRAETGPVLRAAGLRPLRLAAKEGLALLNGTDGMLAMLVLACVDAAKLFRTGDVTCAMSVEASLATDRPFAPELQAIRPHPGQARSAANLGRLLAGSPIVASHRGSDHAVQDAYSLRCHPQVMGAARDTLDFAAQVATRELAAAVDNPVVLPDGRIESTGNFHGEPLAFAGDFLAVAAAEVGAIAERRIDRLLDPNRSRGLPAFLAPEPGVNSGLMIAQYTAAALVAENRRLAQPASLDSLPTSGMQEDHVSMGWSAGLKLRRVLENLARVLAIEAVCGAHGLDLRAPLAPAGGTGAVRDRLRTRVAGPGPDRFLAPDLAAAEELVRCGSLLQAAQDAVGPLG
ncbi:MAG TPA: histidine ammonia-lyase [Chloroflexota bacterium]|jgi:histidine ammonia-lyase|nr:histidine ammonia-lyase [Chloroflexota bacterium]